MSGLNIPTRGDPRLREQCQAPLTSPRPHATVSAATSMRRQSPNLTDRLEHVVTNLVFATVANKKCRIRIAPIGKTSGR